MSEGKINYRGFFGRAGGRGERDNSVSVRGSVPNLGLSHRDVCAKTLPGGKGASGGLGAMCSQTPGARWSHSYLKQNIIIISLR